MSVKTTEFPKTIRELLALEPDRISYDSYEIGDLWGYHLNFFPEVHDAYGHDFDRIDEEKRIKITFLKDYCFDGRRTYTLAFVSVDDEPKIIYYRYGRDGCDGYGYYSIGENGWSDLNKVLLSYCERGNDDCSHIVYNLDDEISSSFTDFYGYNITSDFQPWR